VSIVLLFWFASQQPLYQHIAQLQTICAAVWLLHAVVKVG
jgi:hypothetical protein